MMDDHQIAMWGLLVGVVAAVAAIVAAVAGIKAVIYAKDAPTKDDLARVEENTAHLEEVHAHLAKMNIRDEQQEYRERVSLLAERVHMTVSGMNLEYESFPLHLRIPDANVVPSTIELHDEVGALYGRFGFTGTHPDWEAVIEAETISKWFNARVHLPNFNRAKLVVRVVMLMGDIPASRQVPVILERASIPISTSDEPGAPLVNTSGWRIEGGV